jgi:choline kinase
MNFIILGDKYSRGTKTKGCSALIQYNKRRNVIETQCYNILRSKPRSKIIYVYGYEDKKIENYFQSNKIGKNKNIHLIYNPEHAITGHCNSLAKAKAFFNEDCFICFGNTIVNHKIFRDMDETNSQVFTTSEETGLSEIGSVIENGQVENLFYELPNKCTNTYYINKTDSRVLEALVTDHSHRNLFIFEIINKMISHGINMYPTKVSKKSIIKISKGKPL